MGNPAILNIDPQTIKAGLGFVVVKIDQPMVEDIKYKSLDLKFNPTYDVYKNTKIMAEVVSVCAKLPDIPFFTDNPGFPLPLQRIGRDGRLYPTPFKAKYITTMMQENVVKVGDLAYFHYLTLHESNLLGEDEEGMRYYRCAYNHVFCVVRDGKIHMANGYMLVEPIWGSDLVDIELDELNMMQKPTGNKRKLKVRMTRTGIIHDIENKPIWAHGKVKYVGGLIDNRDYGLEVGADIIFMRRKNTKTSGFKNTIEGVEYYVMNQWDAVATVVDGKLTPVGDYVILQPFIKAEGLIKLVNEEKPTQAKVLAVGNMARYVDPGDHVYYKHSNSWTMELEGHTGIIAKENQIYGTYEKSNEPN